MNQATTKFVVRPFRVVHEAKASHYISKLSSIILHFDFCVLTFLLVAFSYQLCLMNQATTKFVVRPFRVVHEAKAAHYIFHFCSVILHFDF